MKDDGRVSKSISGPQLDEGRTILLAARTTVAASVLMSLQRRTACVNFCLSIWNPRQKCEMKMRGPIYDIGWRRRRDASRWLPSRPSAPVSVASLSFLPDRGRREGRGRED